MRDKIRGLVAGSVEGLTPDHVYLTLVPVTPVVESDDASSNRKACVAASDGKPRRGDTLTLIVMTMMAMALIVSAWVWGKGIRSFAPTFFRRRKIKKTAEQSAGKKPDTSTGKDTP
jgi:type III secretion protein J